MRFGGKESLMEFEARMIKTLVVVGSGVASCIVTMCDCKSWP